MTDMPPDVQVAHDALNDRQRNFAREYAIDFNGHQAALRAGYAERGAKAQASRLLTNVNLVAYVKYLTEQKAESQKFDANRLLAEATELFESAKRAAIEHGEDGSSPDPAMYNAARGFLDTIGKHIDVQAFKERLDVNMKTDHADVIEEALNRAERGRKPRERADGS